VPGAPEPAESSPRPVNLACNTKADEDDPHLSPDGLKLFYASNASGDFDLMVSQRRAAGAEWPAGKPITELNTKVGDRSPCLVTTRGGYPHFLYFATQKDEEQKNFDLYFAVKQNARADFTAPTPVHAVCTDADELHPWVTGNGRELYFSRKTKEGWRTFASPKPGGYGAFEEAKPVDLPVDFHHPTLAPDGLTMYVQGPLEKQRWGLFRVKRATAKAAWSKPEPLDELNHAEGATGDRSPSLSRDGTMLYFASDRPGGKGGLDLWAVPVSQLGK
jgi:hypothetical protein